MLERMRYQTSTRLRSNVLSGISSLDLNRCIDLNKLALWDSLNSLLLNLTLKVAAVYSYCSLPSSSNWGCRKAADGGGPGGARPLPAGRLRAR